MQSTRQFLENKLHKLTGNHDQRLTALGVEAPEEYTCAIHCTVMDEPVNLSPPDHENSYFVERVSVFLLNPKPVNARFSMCSGDEPSALKLRIHPTTNQGIMHELRVNQELQSIIASYVFIEEIHAHLQKLEESRLKTLISMQKLDEDQLDCTLLLLDSNEVIAARGIHLETVPKHFFCSHKKDSVMTFPVKIDNKHIIDFYCLNKNDPEQPKPYLNPITATPISSIDIEYQLLQEIDSLLDPFELQMKKVESNVATFNRNMNTLLDKSLHGKTYSKILLDEQHPADKIPESLALGRIPGREHLEVMTHPVLLDGEHLIDLLRLQEFWKPRFGMFFQRRDCRGINPFTNKPIRTISYHHELKEGTDRFMLNRETFKLLLNQQNVRDATYLLPRAKPFHTIQKCVVNRRDLLKHPGNK